MWGPAQNNGLAKYRPIRKASFPRRSHSQNIIQAQLRQNKTVRGVTPPRTPRSPDQEARPNHCNSSSEYIKKNKTPKYLVESCYHHIKCATTTLLAILMRKRPLNSTTLTTATHKGVIKVSDRTGAQVEA